jgi:hypothetical protein
MSDVQIGRSDGGAHRDRPDDAATLGFADWLHLAATPTFLAMALSTGVLGGAPDMTCMALQDASPLTGMTAMYLLMSCFHLSPWLSLIAGRGRRGASRS